MAFDSRDLMINLPSVEGTGLGYQLTCKPLSPYQPGDDKGKPKPPCPAPSCQNSTGGPKPPIKPGPKRSRQGDKLAGGLLALRQQLRQTLSREQ
jgi:hypothetical protein